MKSIIEMAAAKHALRMAMGWRWGGKHTRKWHGLPQGILGVGFGVKRSDGKIAAQDCIRVYVRKKMSQRKLTRRQRIPTDIDGVPTDVIAVAMVRTHSAPGDSVGNRRGVSGTLTCIVKDDSAEYILGSWHVLTNTYGQDGDPVYGPSLALDGGAQVIGRLIATPTFHLNGGSNAFDASVARVESGAAGSANINGLGALMPTTVAAAQSIAVMKKGAASAVTQGSVDGVSEDISINYNGDAALNAVLAGQIAIVGAAGEFSGEGDSGALVCTPDLRPVGMIVGGSQSSVDSPVAHSFASPIQSVLDFYQVAIKA
jgi:hypothetical protein